MQSKKFRLISFCTLAECLLPLDSRRSVEFHSIFLWNCYANCSSELANCYTPIPHAARVHKTFYLNSPLCAPNFLCRKQPVSSVFHPLHSGINFLYMYFLLIYDLNSLRNHLFSESKYSFLARLRTTAVYVSLLFYSCLALVWSLAM